MKAPLPYHFCGFPGCQEMVPEKAPYCAYHIAVMEERRAIAGTREDLFFSEVEDDFADANQPPLTDQSAAPGDASKQEESHG